MDFFPSSSPSSSARLRRYLAVEPSASSSLHHQRQPGKATGVLNVDFPSWRCEIFMLWSTQEVLSTVASPMSSRSPIERFSGAGPPRSHLARHRALVTLQKGVLSFAHLSSRCQNKAHWVLLSTLYNVHRSSNKTSRSVVCIYERGERRLRPSLSACFSRPSHSRRRPAFGPLLEPRGKRTG